MKENKIIRVGIIQKSFTDDVELNRQSNLSSIAALADEGADLIVLSELHDSLYFCQTENVDNFDLAVELPGEFTDFYSEAARTNKVVIVTSAFERRAPGLYHNTAVVFDTDGSIAGKYRKMHIPDDPGFYEKFYFTPGDMGFRPIDTSLGRLGVLVCWDQWYPEAARLMAMQGAEMLIYPTAIGWNPDDDAEEKARQREAWITVQVGFEEDPTLATSGIDFWGSSFIAGPQGEILYMAPESQSASATVDIDIQRTEDVRRWWPFLRDRRIDHYDKITHRFID